MKVYILISRRLDDTVEHVFLNKKDAEDMLKSCPKELNACIEEHEVIE